MRIDELQTELERAESYSDWVDVVAGAFDAQELYFGHGTDNADDEAYWLIRHLQDWEGELDDSAPDPALIPKLIELYRQRVEERVPLAYLLGEAWFAGLRFEVDRRVLIPRSPLAEIIERRFEPWCRLSPGDRVLEVGTGSGCIAIAVAHYCPEIEVDATDTDPAALELARRNVERHQVEDRVRLCEADLFPSGNDKYRVIISNPPYVPDGEIETLPAEYRHEPPQALAGGRDGLDPARRLMAGAAERLTDDGVLIVEVGNAAEDLMQAEPELPAIWVEFEHGGSGVFVMTAADLRLRER